ncbi:MAG TPA: hypothetical protein VNF06_01425, partial [Candidatus Aquilonibacter sp.]|nr:hypothetical protein [Candidatus Aquilonibacter sp.]
MKSPWYMKRLEDSVGRLSFIAERDLRKSLNLLKRDEDKKGLVKIYLETYERKGDLDGIRSIFEQLPRAFDELSKEEVIRYLSMHLDQKPLAHRIAHGANKEVREKIYTLSYAREILEMECDETTLHTVAIELMDSKYITPAEKARVLSTLGFIDKKEEELTRLILSNLIEPNYARESSISVTLLNPDFVELDYPTGLNPVYEVLVDDIGMSEKQVQKLAKAIDAAGTNVKKALAAKTLSHLYVYYGMTRHREMFDYIMDNCPTNKLLDALDHFPSLIGLRDLISREAQGLLEKDNRAILTMQDITEILTSGNIEQEFMNRVAARVEEMIISFKSSFDLKALGKEGKEALKERNFLIDLLLFESKYDYEPKRILNMAATEFLEKGTLAFKELKFRGHELADEQLGGSLGIRTKLMGLDSLSVSHLQKSVIPFDFFENSIRNYQNHRTHLRSIIDGIRSYSSGELSKLEKEAKDQELKRLITSGDFDGLRAHRARGGDAKIKGRAIWALNLQNSKESADAAEGLIKEILELKNKSAEEQESIMMTLSNRWRDGTYRWIA